jgi:molybdopterin synthase sulfur carrier subunit
MMADAPLRILFFASLRDAVGIAELTLAAPPAGTLQSLWPELLDRLGADAVAELQAENVRIAVNQALTSGPLGFVAGDEIAFLPPVTGG